MRIKGWSSEVALADITGYVAVTRFTDPANNSDKYRRFITLAAPGENHLHVQHTGRWTSRTDMGRWIEGVWRPQGTAKNTAMRNHSNPADYNDEMVRRKIGSYHIEPAGSGSRMLTSSEISDIIQRASLEDSVPATPAPATPAATRPISGQPPKSVDVTAAVKQQVNGSTPVPTPGPDADLADKLNNLITRAASGDDPFDLFADLAAIRPQVQAEVRRAQQLDDQLRLATETLMAKV